MTQTQKLINRTYEFWKDKFHTNPRNRGKELHHINSRIGVFKCCPMLFIGLTKQEHHDWRVRKIIREEHREIIKKVQRNFTKILGCQKPIAEVYCLICPALYKPETKNK